MYIYMYIYIIDIPSLFLCQQWNSLGHGNQQLRPNGDTGTVACGCLKMCQQLEIGRGPSNNAHTKHEHKRGTDSLKRAFLAP